MTRTAKQRLIAMMLALVASGCGGGGGGGQSGPNIDPANFVAQSTNPYFALTPGTVFTFNAQTDGVPQTITVTVTRDTKMILGVPITVVHDVVTQGGQVAEDTFDWYAQDKDGNVWYFGEDTKAFDNGQVSTEGSWEAGVHGAQPGIIMEAHPQVGDAYRQEFSRGVAQDRAQVLSLNESATVPYGSFQNCLKTKEFSDLEPGIVENKVYCLNVGQVSATTVQGGTDFEMLVSITHE